MFQSAKLKRFQPWLERCFVLVLTSMIVLSSAASCTIPGFQNNQKSQSSILGVLKQDPTFTLPNGTKRDGFGAINAVKLLDGTYQTNGLSDVSGLKIIQISKDEFYFVSQTRGVFKSIKTREINGQKYDFDVTAWERKYIFPIPQEATQEQVDSLVAKNNNLLISHVSVNPQKPQTLFVSGKLGQIGKIYKSTDSGNSFKEVYSEIQNGIGVVTSSIDPRNENQIFAALEGGSILRSLDGGLTWGKIRNINDSVLQIGFVPEFDNFFYIFSKSKGIITSPNNGDTWTELPLSRNPQKKAGVEQPKDVSLNQNILKTEKFGVYEKLIPVTAQKGKWLLIADRQIWFTDAIDKPFTKLVLPLEKEQLTFADAQPDPQKGLDRIFVSIENKLFETQNKGQSWSTNDRINLSSPIGNIGQIVIDRENTQIIYLMLVDPKNTRSSSVFGL
jgi:hypothetical protein